LSPLKRAMSNPEKHPALHSAESPVPLAWFGDASQDEFEIDFYGRIAERNPSYVQVLRSLSELLARKGLYERSLAVDRRLVALLPDDCLAHYNLACSLAMSHRSGEAIAELRRAIEQGYSDFGYLEVDSDLDSLRNEPAYQALLQEFGIGGPAKKAKSKKPKTKGDSV
jgi:tetratricopeptide (TPR) repeat protein